MRALFLAAVLFGLVAPFASAGGVYACSCAFPRTEAEAREAIAAADLAVVAKVDGFSDDDHLVLAVESVLNDQPIPPRIAVAQDSETTQYVRAYDYGNGLTTEPSCRLWITGEVGERYLITAYGTPDEPYELSMCSAINRIDAIQNADVQSISHVYQSLISEPGRAPDPDAPLFPGLQETEADHKDVPWIPILILAFIVPTAALVIPAFFMAKKAEDGKGPPS